MRVLIKVGGAALESESAITAVCQAVRALREKGTEVVLVHGGGKSINRELERRGIVWEFIEGQRKTTREMMEVIEATLFGIVNRKLVRALQMAGISAAGLSGVDAHTLQCVASDPRLGQVGKIERVSPQLIEAMLGAGIVPVVAPIGGSSGAEAFNVNADWAASKLACALSVNALVFLTDQMGVLNQDGKVLSILSTRTSEEMISRGVVQGGMLAKIRAILDALEEGVPLIRVAHAHEAVAALFGRTGTAFERHSGLSRDLTRSEVAHAEAH